MEVELLVIPGCPNEAAAAELVRGVLDELGRTDTPLTVRVVGSQAVADRPGCTGSPTLLVNGNDPFAEPGQAPALACRVYPTAAGLRGLPDADAVRAALCEAADRTGESRCGPRRPTRSRPACRPGPPGTWMRWRPGWLRT